VSVPKGIRFNIPGEFGENVLWLLAVSGPSIVEETLRQLWRKWLEHWALGEGGEMMGNEFHYAMANTADVVCGPCPASLHLRGKLQDSLFTHDRPP
jgi:hypothetical protein